MASHSKVRRVEYYSQTFDKGRRPRRRLSSQGRRAVGRLQSILAIIAGLSLIYGAWFYHKPPVKPERLEPPSSLGP